MKRKRLQLTIFFSLSKKNKLQKKKMEVIGLLDECSSQSIGGAINIAPSHDL